MDFKEKLTSIRQNAINLFSRKAYFDKQATINKYFSIVEESERPHVDSFEELYQVALQWITFAIYKHFQSIQQKY